MGVRRLDGDSSYEGSRLGRNPTFVLGPYGVSPLAMAGAYATFAARGVFCPPNPIESITDSRGDEVALPRSPCSQVIEREVADQVTSILRGVIDGPAPHRTGRAASIGRPAAGKTGTTNDSKAAWFIGYTPQLATAVWIGKKTPTPMQGVTINGRHYEAVYGGSIPAPIWKQVMEGALQGVPAEDFTAPAKVDTGTLVPVPDVTGQPVEVAEQTLRDAGFGVLVGAASNAAPVPAGAVARTLPLAGTPIPAGSTVTIVPSTGRPPAVTATAAPTVASPAPAPTKPGNGPPASPAPTSAPSPTPSPTKKGPPR
jgi:membrane peptidoglycan carboxypeptidase